MYRLAGGRTHGRLLRGPRAAHCKAACALQACMPAPTRMHAGCLPPATTTTRCRSVPAGAHSPLPGAGGVSGAGAPGTAQHASSRRRQVRAAGSSGPCMRRCCIRHAASRAVLMLTVRRLLLHAPATCSLQRWRCAAAAQACRPAAACGVGARAPGAAALAPEAAAGARGAVAAAQGLQRQPGQPRGADGRQCAGEAAWAACCSVNLCTALNCTSYLRPCVLSAHVACLSVPLPQVKAGEQVMADPSAAEAARWLCSAGRHQHQSVLPWLWEVLSEEDLQHVPGEAGSRLAAWPPHVLLGCSTQMHVLCRQEH